MCFIIDQKYSKNKFQKLKTQINSVNKCIHFAKSVCVCESGWMYDGDLSVFSACFHCYSLIT